MRKVTLSKEGGPVRIGGKVYPSASDIPAKVLLTANVSGAPLAHLTREVIRRQAAGKLADSTFTAKQVQAAVQAGDLPSVQACKDHLADLAAQRKARAAARKAAAAN